MAQASIFATSGAPNAMALVRCGDRRLAVVASSSAALLDVIDLDSDDRATRSVALPIGSSPWDVAIVDTAAGMRAVVALYDRHELALVDVCAATPFVVDTCASTRVLTLEPPRTVGGRTVASMPLQNPQGVATSSTAAGATAFVVWGNVLSVAFGDEAMQTGPGVLGAYRIVDDAFVLDMEIDLPCDNPGGIVVDGDTVHVACTGRYRDGVDGFARASQGGLVSIDVDTLTVRDAIAFDHSPLAVTIDADSIVVGDALDGGMRRYDAALVEQADVGAQEEIASIFALTHVDDVLVAARFEDAVVADPFGAAHTTSVQTGSTLRGAIDVAAFDDDDDVFILFSLSAELQRLSRTAVLAP
ncbi:MAG TPA: hypothetical protein VGF99_09685 [Myxococcota bacterium]